MYPSVAAAFWESVSGIEGVTRWPYLDNEGWVTCATGIKVDNGSGHAPPLMLSLPWKHIDGTPATNAEIEAGWQKVKAQQAWKLDGGGQDEWANLTDLRLDDAAIQQATTNWLQQNEPTLRRYFPGYDTIPADAQLGLLGMSYAMGSGFAVSPPGYPKFVAAMNAVVPNYETAANESSINQNVTSAIEEHNAVNKQLFLNAAAAQHSTTPYSELWWPTNLDPGGTAAMAFRGAGVRTSPMGLAKRVLIASGLAAAGVFGLASYSAVKHGKPWTTPATDLVAGAKSFGRGVDSRVRGILR